MSYFFTIKLVYGMVFPVKFVADLSFW